MYAFAFESVMLAKTGILTGASNTGYMSEDCLSYTVGNPPSRMMTVCADDDG